MIGLNSFIITPTGAKKAGDLNINDRIYTFKDKINVERIKYKNVCKREAIDIRYYSQSICTASVNSLFIVSDERRKHIKKIKRLNKVSHHDVIYRKFVFSFLGHKNIKDAYCLGALLGDGCSRYLGNSIFISSQNDKIPNHVAKQLGAPFVRKSDCNYTYSISNGIGPAGNIGHKPVKCSYYESWCKNRYAHEKIIDLKEIKTWNRISLIKLISGILDTDGTVELCNGRLTLSWFSQSKSIIEALFYIILSVWQVEPLICVDNRNKYVNGPVYKLYIRKNLFSQKIIFDCNKFLQTKRLDTIVGSKADLNFVQPKLVHCGVSDLVDFKTKGFIITANQGVLLGKENK